MFYNNVMTLQTDSNWWRIRLECIYYIAYHRDDFLEANVNRQKFNKICARYKCFFCFVNGMNSLRISID